MRELKKIEPLISNKELTKQIKKLAKTINEDYGIKESLILICTLKGAVMFYCELAKYLKMPVQMEFISLSSYGNSTKSSGNIKNVNISLSDIENKNVIIVEDIIDTGLTLDFLVKYIRKNYKVKSLKVATLFDKKCARKYDIKPDYSCFDIDNKFIVGFGLDYCGLYRNLDYIGYFE